MSKQSRKTKQKGLITNEISFMDSFFTAEDIHKKIRRKDSKIGIATVYRLLRQLKKENKLHHYSCGKKTIFSIDERNHSHFACEKCGKVFHINVKSLDFFKEAVKGKACHFQLDVYGICENCLD